MKPTDKLRVAFGHYVLGLDQQDLAALYGVNIGRVNEACRAVAGVIKLPLKPNKQ